MSALLSAHIETCKNVCVSVCVCVAVYGVTGRSSSPQTRPDDEEGSGLERSAAVCWVAVSNLGHGLGLRLNEK